MNEDGLLVYSEMHLRECCEQHDAGVYVFYGKETIAFYVSAFGQGLVDEYGVYDWIEIGGKLVSSIRKLHSIHS